MPDFFGCRVSAITSAIASFHTLAAARISELQFSTVGANENPEVMLL
jgi:hypothetical protein